MWWECTIDARRICCSQGVVSLPPNLSSLLIHDGRSLGNLYGCRIRSGLTLTNNMQAGRLHARTRKGLGHDNMVYMGLHQD
jgi:hypothetical protein